MITRQNFGSSYQHFDRDKPFPVGVVTERRNATNPNHLIRGGASTFGPSTPRLMMDPLDPATWQREYIFST